MNAAGLAILLFGLFFYFVPAFVAAMRSHSSTGGVIVLNAFLGWTVLGWIGALVWACSGQHGKPAEA